jgi:phospholipase C
MLLSVAIDPTFAGAAVTVPTTPIQHVVVIFGENISFDHYFGTYPKAQNPPGQPRFTALAGTPAVNGLTQALLTANPNLNPANGAGASNPFRLNRNQALTADQNHNYGPEQASFDGGLMDLFPSKTGTAGGTPNLYPPVVSTKGIVMGYYDGNTVTALWSYAQRFAMSDSSYGTQFGPSTPGALNLISGQTNGIIASTVLNGPASAATSFAVADGQGGYTMIGDADPLGDVCSAPTRFQANMASKNVGDLLNAAGISWGSFMGGFDLTVTNPNGTTGCLRSSISPVTGLSTADYIPHHAWFEYYVSTANPTHKRPTNVASIGLQGDAANHQYDIHDFFDALAAGNLPAVSYLKAPAYQDAHAGYSNPLDEQTFVVNTINTLQKSPFWSSTAVIILYDDSDGWYDHQKSPTLNGSFSNLDVLNGPSACGVEGTTPQLPGPNSNGLPVNGRCGLGVRSPLLVISSWAKSNFVDHTVTDQSSVLRFIEDNWKLGRLGDGSMDAIANPINAMFNFTPATPPNSGALILSPTTGLVQ